MLLHQAIRNYVRELRKHSPLGLTIPVFDCLLDVVELESPLDLLSNEKRTIRFFAPQQIVLDKLRGLGRIHIFNFI